MITAPESILTGRQRAAGFQAAYAAARRAIDSDLAVYASFEDEQAYDTAYRMLMSSAPPTAILAGAGDMVGVLKAAHVLGLSVANDLSVIVIGDAPLSELHSPPLTAVRWDAGRVGLIAAQLLLTRVGDGDTAREPRRILLPTDFLIRHSCAAPGASRGS